MTYSAEKKEAFADLEASIAKLRKAYGYDDDRSVMNGWVLLTNAVSFPEKSDDPDDDDLDQEDSCGFYSRRGQSSTLSYGLLHEAIRHYNYIQLTVEQ